MAIQNHRGSSVLRSTSESSPFLLTRRVLGITMTLCWNEGKSSVAMYVHIHCWRGGVKFTDILPEGEVNLETFSIKAKTVAVAWKSGAN